MDRDASPDHTSTSGMYSLQAGYEENNIVLTIRNPAGMKRAKVNVDDRLKAMVTSTETETKITLHGLLVLRKTERHDGKRMVVDLVRKRTGLAVLDIRLPQWSGIRITNEMSLSAFLNFGDAMALATNLMTEETVTKLADKMGVTSCEKAIEHACRHGYVLPSPGYVLVNRERLHAMEVMEAQRAEKARKAAEASAPKAKKTAKIDKPENKKAIGLRKPKAKKTSKK